MLHIKESRGGINIILVKEVRITYIIFSPTKKQKSAISSERNRNIKSPYTYLLNLSTVNYTVIYSVEYTYRLHQEDDILKPQIGFNV